MLRCAQPAVSARSGNRTGKQLPIQLLAAGAHARGVGARRLAAQAATREAARAAAAGPPPRRVLGGGVVAIVLVPAHPARRPGRADEAAAPPAEQGHQRVRLIQRIVARCSRAISQSFSGVSATSDQRSPWRSSTRARYIYAATFAGAFALAGFFAGFIASRLACMAAMRSTTSPFSSGAPGTSIFSPASAFSTSSRRRCA